MNAKVLVSVINVIITIINLFVAKIYKKYSKSKKANFEATKTVISVGCSIFAFLVSFTITICGLFSVVNTTASDIFQLTEEELNDQIEITSESNTVGRWNIILSAIAMVIKVAYDLISFLNTEKNKVETYKSYNGVFAVSAIIVTKDIKFILVKRKGENNDLWVQPGVYYRTNTLRPNAEQLPSFYEKIKESLELECGLTGNMYEIIPLNSMVDSEVFIVDAGKYNEGNVVFKDNQLSPTPFVIQKEKAKSKELSNTEVHIDGFYAFKVLMGGDELLNTLNSNIPPKAKYDQVGIFTLEEIEAMCSNVGLFKAGIKYSCYSDLSIIVEKFMAQWRKCRFLDVYNKNVRYCTFDSRNNTIWIRLNTTCNLKCQFCLMKTKKYTSSSTIFDLQEFTAFWLANTQNFNFKDDREYHLVITGGEPFLVDKLYEVIDFVNNSSNGRIKKISICTNGTCEIDKNLNRMLDEQCNFKNKLKFVINMSAYNEDTFGRITRASTSLFRKQCIFIKHLQANGISNIVANVVMTNVFKENLSNYFEYWKRMNIRSVALSYSIQLGIKHRNEVQSIHPLTKKECTALYRSLGNGKYPIEYLDHLELMLPSCDEKTSCRENTNIWSLEIDNGQNWQMTHGCLDIQ